MDLAASSREVIERIEIEEPGDRHDNTGADKFS